MFSDVGSGIHDIIDAADKLTRLLNTINNAGPAANATLTKLFGGLTAVATPGGQTPEPNIPGIPGNLFPGGPIFAGPGAPATNVTVNVTGNNIDNQVDVDAMAQQLAAAVADGQRSAANAPPNTLVGAA
jgi:hypothetical protein